MRGGRAAPQSQQHVHVQPEDGEERDGEGRGEEEALHSQVQIYYRFITESESELF